MAKMRKFRGVAGPSGEKPHAARRAVFSGVYGMKASTGPTADVPGKRSTSHPNSPTNTARSGKVMRRPRLIVLSL